MKGSVFIEPLPIIWQNNWFVGGRKFGASNLFRV